MNTWTFEFGPFELNPGRQELRRSGVRLRLPPSSFRLLVLFVSRSGELITRDEIAACLWKDEQNVDIMSGINTAVKQLRSHLGDDSTTPRYIETLVGAGYRFIAPVVEIPKPAGPAEEPVESSEVSIVAVPDVPPQDSSPVPAASVSSVERDWRPAIASAALLVVAVLFGFYRLHPPTFSGATPRAEMALAHITSSGDLRSANISPDGKFIAFIRETAGRQSLWVKQLATDSMLQLVDLGSDHCPGVAFSPDGGYVYFVRKAELSASGVLFEVSFLGGDPVRVLAVISGAPAISPDGRKVAFIRSTLSTHDEDSVETAGVDGSGERTLASYKAPGIHLNRIAWTPDGSTLVYPVQSHLMAMPAEGGVPQQVPGAQCTTIEDLWPLPPGRDMIVVGEIGGALRTQIYIVSLPGGAIRQVTHDFSHYAAVRATADGKTLLAVQDQVASTIQVIAPASESEARTISAGNQNLDGVQALAWTPEGKLLYGSEPDQRGEIWEMGRDGSSPRRLVRVNAPAAFSGLAVSPRGDFIAVSRWSDDDVASIWRMDLNGHDQMQLTSAKQDFPPSITPDGQWVVYGSVQQDKSVLMKVPSKGALPSGSQTTRRSHPRCLPMDSESLVLRIRPLISVQV